MRLDELVPVAQETGVRLLFENLSYDCDYPLLSLAELREAFEPYPAESAGLVIDTGHAVISGRDPAGEIHAAGIDCGEPTCRTPMERMTAIGSRATA